MTKTEKQVLSTLRVIHELTEAPVRTLNVAECLCMTDRNVRRVLIDLEQRGQIRRASPRGGWLIEDTPNITSVLTSPRSAA